MIEFLKQNEVLVFWIGLLATTGLMIALLKTDPFRAEAKRQAVSIQAGEAEAAKTKTATLLDFEIAHTPARVETVLRRAKIQGVNSKLSGIVRNTVVDFGYIISYSVVLLVLSLAVTDGGNARTSLVCLVAIIAVGDLVENGGMLMTLSFLTSAADGATPSSAATLVTALASHVKWISLIVIAAALGYFVVAQWGELSKWMSIPAVVFLLMLVAVLLQYAHSVVDLIKS